MTHSNYGLQITSMPTTHALQFGLFVTPNVYLDVSTHNNMAIEIVSSVYWDTEGHVNFYHAAFPMTGFV